MAGGRPKTYNEEQIQEISLKLEKYIAEEDIPIVAEFAYLNDVPRNTLYDYTEFSTLLKKLIDKKEAQLERKGLTNEVNTGMAIFSLKQLGWRDRQEMLMDTRMADTLDNIREQLVSSKEE